MPSRKGYSQCVTWLKSKMAEGDTLDAINAELCYNVLCDLKKRRDAIGARFHQVMMIRDQKEMEIEGLQMENSSLRKTVDNLKFDVNDLQEALAEIQEGDAL